jgi:chromosome segregation ATPase
MQREINPQLFQQPTSTTPSSKLVPQRIESDLKELAAQVHQLRTHNQMLERKMEQINLQNQELTNKFMTLASKSNERRVSDAKIQDLIDRHNTLIMNFENRMTHMSRIMSEQEMKLYNATAALEDSRREIARLRTTKPL